MLFRPRQPLRQDDQIRDPGQAGQLRRGRVVPSLIPADLLGLEVPHDADPELAMVRRTMEFFCGAITDAGPRPTPELIVPGKIPSAAGGVRKIRDRSWQGNGRSRVLQGTTIPASDERRLNSSSSVPRGAPAFSAASRAMAASVISGKP